MKLQIKLLFIVRQEQNEKAMYEAKLRCLKIIHLQGVILKIGTQK